MDIQYFGHYDLNGGNYLGFYPTDIWNEENIPTPKIELTRDEWQTAVSGRCKVVNGVHTYFPITQEELDVKELSIVRSKRDFLLKESDWVVLPHSPITGSKLEEWITYRQELRDITNSTPYAFPTQPQN